jgi:hypothetical protein
MTFIQPFILMALPLISLPLIIHFVNRIRHRSMPWAAMRFLTLARRSSTKFAKLRQFLILLFRVLAILCLLLAIARPLLGGWLGFMFAGPPDTVFIVLDRSASMEARSANAGAVKRERAAALLTEAARNLGTAPHYILVDSATGTMTPVIDLKTLEAPAVTGPTDADADIPALLEAVFEEIITNSTGTTEIWLASDLQKSNWQPDAERWQELVARYRALPQKVAFRLLDMPEQPAANVSIRVPQVIRHDALDRSWLELKIELRTSQADGRKLPVTIYVDGIQDQIIVELESSRITVRETLQLPADAPGGMGKLTIPHDQNTADNIAFFGYGLAMDAHTLVVADAPEVATTLAFAAAPLPGVMRQDSRMVAPGAFVPEELADIALLVWQSRTVPPESELRTFIENGGILFLLPPGTTSGDRLFGLAGWQEVEPAPEDAGMFNVTAWQREQGLLRDTADGTALEFANLEVETRQPMLPGGVVLASFDDGVPFLTQRSFGKGLIVECATLPGPQWSTLDDGMILVPLVQRLLAQATGRFADVEYWPCGTESPERGLTPLMVARPEEVATPASMAGVYKKENGTLVVVVRPEREDTPLLMDGAEVENLFNGVKFSTITNRVDRSENLQSEVWKIMICGSMLFLALAGLLTLEQSTINRREGQPA